MSNAMFDEKSPLWLSRFKTCIVVVFWVLLIGGVLLGIFDMTYVVDILNNDTIFEVLIWSVVGVILAFAHLLFGMLTLNFLENVQAIRQKIEHTKN